MNRCLVRRVVHLPASHGRASRQSCLRASERADCLLPCLSLQPLIELVPGQYLEIRLHVVVTQSAELRAHDFELSGLRGCEMNRDDDSRNEILLNPQLADVETMPHIFGVDRQQEWLGSPNLCQ